MIHEHVPPYFMENTLHLSAIVNLPFDINILHHVFDEFAPLTILPPLPKEPQVNVPVQESTELILEEEDEAMRKRTRSSTKMQVGPSPASKKPKEKYIFQTH